MTVPSDGPCPTCGARKPQPVRHDYRITISGSLNIEKALAEAHRRARRNKGGQP